MRMLPFLVVESFWARAQASLRFCFCFETWSFRLCSRFEAFRFWHRDKLVCRQIIRVFSIVRLRLICVCCKLFAVCIKVSSSLRSDSVWRISSNCCPCSGSDRRNSTNFFLRVLLPVRSQSMYKQTSNPCYKMRSSSFVIDQFPKICEPGDQWLCLR